MNKVQHYHSEQKWCKRALIFALTISLLFLLGGISSANDLDDGIPIDDISNSDSIKPDICVSCIKRNAKSDAIAKSKEKSKSAGGDNKPFRGAHILKKERP